jgi:hypothetical protein
MGADYAAPTSRGAKEKTLHPHRILLLDAGLWKSLWETYSPDHRTTFHKIPVAESETDDKSLSPFHRIPTEHDESHDC